MRRVVIALAAAVGLAACAAPDDADPPAMAEAAEPVELGPVDGRDLPGTDLDRVQVGDVAPDFSVRSLAGSVVTLSDFRGEKNVILVFYRGYW